jgi:Putative transposase DNA-binding domain
LPNQLIGAFVDSEFIPRIKTEFTKITALIQKEQSVSNSKLNQRFELRSRGSCYNRWYPVSSEQIHRSKYRMRDDGTYALTVIPLDVCKIVRNKFEKECIGRLASSKSLTLRAPRPQGGKVSLCRSGTVRFGLLVDIWHHAESVSNDRTAHSSHSDPGVAVLAATCDSNGRQVLYGQHARFNLEAINLKMDSVRSAIDDCKEDDDDDDAKMFELQTTFAHLSRRKKGFVRQLHYSVINHMVANANHLHVPRLDVSRLMRKSKDFDPSLPYHYPIKPTSKPTTVGKKTRRQMASLSLCKFWDRLKARVNQVNQVPGVKKDLDNTNESYTSRACVPCQRVVKSIRNRVFKCTECGCEEDRDVHGCCNIRIRDILTYVKPADLERILDKYDAALERIKCSSINQ